ncbi:MAG: DUF1700 domain-containing protein [Parvularculaceae bacterium]|nr:DUF1700 domain-containing protein [Parvularculaceae bacterium]
MADDKAIDTYLKGLTRALRTLPDSDRDEIAAEIRAHLEHRAREGRLQEAMKALGAPEKCARGFLEEIRIQDAFADGGPAKTVGALLAFASRRVTAAAGLFVSGVFFLIAVGFAITAAVEVVAPDKAGLWVGREAGVYVFGTYDAPAPPDAPLAPGAPAAPAPPRELLGRWLLPVAAGLSVVAFIIGQWLARIFVRLMAQRKSRGAI